MNQREVQTLSRLEARMDDLRDALVGTELQPNGLLAKQADTDAQQANIDRRLARLERIVDGGKWFFAGACALSTHSIYELIQKLLTL